jgi:hypothetical protein
MSTGSYQGACIIQARSGTTREELLELARGSLTSTTTRQRGRGGSTTRESRRQDPAGPAAVPSTIAGRVLAHLETKPSAICFLDSKKGRSGRAVAR